MLHPQSDKAYFSDIAVKTFIRALPTRWRRKPAGIEITSLSLYVQKAASMRRKTCRQVLRRVCRRSRLWRDCDLARMWLCSSEAATAPRPSRRWAGVDRDSRAGPHHRPAPCPSAAPRRAQTRVVLHTTTNRRRQCSERKCAENCNK